MSALGSIFNIASSALSAHKYDIQVTSNNIANVDTPGYTRQTALLQASSPEKSNNLIMGRGVEIDSVTSASDRFIEGRLQDQKTSLSFYQEQNTYVENIEQIFSPNSDSDVSSLLSSFWNSWQEVSNNPSGTSERIVLSDNSALLSETFNQLDSEMGSLVKDLNGSLDIGLEKVNGLTRDIADLNQEILKAEAGGGSAHTLRDIRNAKVGEVAEYMNISSFESEQGALTIMAGNGIDLVRGNSSFNLEMDDGGRILISGSGSQQWDITENTDSGKIGGWLDMRDDLIPGYQKDLDAVSNALIWQVNSQHSQGAGLENFEGVSGTYAVTDATLSPLSSEGSGLSYWDKIITDDPNGGTVGFKLWVNDGTGSEPSLMSPILIDGGTTLDSLAEDINNVTGISSRVTDENSLEITVDADSEYTFAFSDDTSNVLAALGINTFFTGDSADNMGINDTVQSGGAFIAAGFVDDVTGERALGDNTNAMAMAELQFTSMTMGDEDGTVGILNTTAENYYSTLLGSMGTTAAGISMNKETGEEMVQQLTDMRDSFSAVSLDEEMVNLMTSQSAYAAAAKLITTADEMLNTLLNMK
ncbi:MAG: flagellar hook-associated protein FlgK [Desulfobacterium sp.]